MCDSGLANISTGLRYQSSKVGEMLLSNITFDQTDSSLNLAQKSFTSMPMYYFRRTQILVGFQESPHYTSSLITAVMGTDAN